MGNKANFTVEHECLDFKGRVTSAIQSFDHMQGDTQFVNRLCLKCKQHWYGPESAVREYTRQEWDAYVNS